MKIWHTLTSLKWLEIIVEERFGHPFKLLYLEGSQSFAMTLPGRSRCITLLLDGVSFGSSDSGIPCAQWNAAEQGWSVLLSNTLPAPGVANLTSQLITEKEDGWKCKYDILGLTYWMLTRQEEVGRTDLDEHGRFPATASHAYKNGYLERPIVDEWLHILGQIIERTWPGIELKKHQFSMKVSHDVDCPSRYAFRTTGGMLRAMAGDVLKRGDIKSALLAPWVRMNSKTALHPADPANTFDWIMDTSERHGLSSAFYFICGRTDPIRDADYEPDHAAIRELMRRINLRGHEIGLHPSYGSYKMPSIIKQEANRLRKIASEEEIVQSKWGARMHYLRWDNKKTLLGLADAEIDYDASIGYADKPGFRCGTCFNYPAFNSNEKNIKIHPLIAMDVSVIDKKYLNLGLTSEAFEKFISLKSVCKKVNGIFSLLWHNDQLIDLKEKNFYSSILSK